jgi:hypothetical protein
MPFRLILEVLRMDHITENDMKNAIAKAIHEINIEIAAQSHPVYSHEQILEFKKITELCRFGKVLGIKY